jgi:hypothetical protein
MKKGKFKIGWQKYEDLMEKQLSSPMLSMIMRNIALQNFNMEDAEDDDERDIEDLFNDQSMKTPAIIPISEKLIEEMTVLASFDCWMGHTNFDITPSIKEKLNTIPGIEVLKICSRYRFFVGIGTMFDFAEVRKVIESDILPEGD